MTESVLLYLAFCALRCQNETFQLLGLTDRQHGGRSSVSCVSTVTSSLSIIFKNVSPTHISWSLICNGDTAEDEGVAVVLCGGARLANTLEQLPHGSVLSLTDEPLAGPHVHSLGLQLEVLRQEEREKDKTETSILE